METNFIILLLSKPKISPNKKINKMRRRIISEKDSYKYANLLKSYSPRVLKPGNVSCVFSSLNLQVNI